MRKKKYSFTDISFIPNKGKWQGFVAMIDCRDFPDPDEIHKTLMRFGARNFKVDKVRSDDPFWTIMATVPNKDKRVKVCIKKWLFSGD